MRRFFLALGVGAQVAPRPLPHVIQSAQGAAKRVVGHPSPRGDLKELLQKGDRPAHVRTAQVLGREGEEGLQQVLIVFIQRRVSPPTFLIPQCLGVMALAVRLDPVVDALAGHPEHAGELGSGPPAVELQDGQSAPIEAGVQSPCELALQTTPVPGSQVEPAHALLLDR
jgi:hypothetical protein